jgi:hypothetical protein
MILPILVMLAQAPDTPAEATPAPAPEKPAEEKKPAAEKPIAPAPEKAPLSAEQLSRQVEKIKKMPPEDAVKAAEELGKHLPQLGPEEAKKRALEPAIPEVKNFAALPEVEQVKYSAREFFTQLIAGDARTITQSCGFPFQLEERRLQTPDELFQEWLRNLRAKRTDLLTLYDIEVLSPADMEKKYGKPPARLANLPWRGAKTYLAVANLSGHAAVAVFRQSGAAWAVVGYAD